MKEKISNLAFTLLIVVGGIGLVLGILGYGEDVSAETYDLFITEEEASAFCDSLEESSEVQLAPSLKETGLKSSYTFGTATLGVVDGAEESCMPTCEKNCDGTCKKDGRTCLCISK